MPPPNELATVALRSHAWNDLVVGLAEGDKVVTREVFTGTHSGLFQGIEPTGRRVEINVIDVIRVADGKIVEHWNIVDRLGLMAQLGALPEAPGAAA